MEKSSEARVQDLDEALEKTADRERRAAKKRDRTRQRRQVERRRQKDVLAAARTLVECRHLCVTSDVQGQSDWCAACGSRFMPSTGKWLAPGALLSLRFPLELLGVVGDAPPEPATAEERAEWKRRVDENARNRSGG